MIGGDMSLAISFSLAGNGTVGVGAGYGEVVMYRDMLITSLVVNKCVGAFEKGAWKVTLGNLVSSCITTD